MTVHYASREESNRFLTSSNFGERVASQGAEFWKIMTKTVRSPLGAPLSRFISKFFTRSRNCDFHPASDAKNPEFLMHVCRNTLISTTWLHKKGNSVFWREKLSVVQVIQRTKPSPLFFIAINCYSNRKCIWISIRGNINGVKATSIIYWILVYWYVALGDMLQQQKPEDCCGGRNWKGFSHLRAVHISPYNWDVLPTRNIACVSRRAWGEHTLFFVYMAMCVCVWREKTRSDTRRNSFPESSPPRGQPARVLGYSSPSKRYMYTPRISRQRRNSGTRSSRESEPASFICFRNGGLVTSRGGRHGYHLGFAKRGFPILVAKIILSNTVFQTHRDDIKTIWYLEGCDRS